MSSKIIYLRWCSKNRHTGYETKEKKNSYLSGIHLLLLVFSLHRANINDTCARLNILAIRLEGWNTWQREKRRRVKGSCSFLLRDNLPCSTSVLPCNAIILRQQIRRASTRTPANLPNESILFPLFPAFWLWETGAKRKPDL